MTDKMQRAVFQLKITLDGVSPEITRRIQVYEDTTLPQLHRYIQAVMNWEDYHLHEFVVNGRVYAVPDPEEPREASDERRVRLAKILKAVGTQFEYHYDFGDGWEHDLLLEAVLIPEPGAYYPRCISATRNAPPEDCGGSYGYMEYVEAMADRMHPRHRELRDWRGPYDPEFCSLDLLNERLKVVSKALSPAPLEPIFVSPYSVSRKKGRTVEIELTERERDLIVNHTFADEDLIRDLKNVIPKSQSRKYRFKWDELDDLAGYIAAEANHARNRKLVLEWERIYGKLAVALDSRQTVRT